MEVNDYYTNSKSSTEKEESLLLKRLITLQKQLEDDDKPNLLNTKTLLCAKENVIVNSSNSSSNFKYRKINNYNVNKFLSTKVDNRNLTKNQNKFKHHNLLTKINNLSSKSYVKPNSLNLTSSESKTVIKKINPEIKINFYNTEKYNLEINEIVENSHVRDKEKKASSTTDVSETLLTTIDKYMINVQDYLTSSKYVVNKEDISISPSNQASTVKNVHFNRKFQKQLVSNNLQNSSLKSTPNVLLSIKKPTPENKKKSVKRLSGRLIESPHLVKIGNTKLIRQSLIRNKWKINNKINDNTNSSSDRKPLSTLPCPTLNTAIASYNKTKWTKVSSPTLKGGIPNKSNHSNINKLKWTRPNLLLVNNVNNNDHSAVSQSDKLILFGKNKIIRQSLISSAQSNNKNHLLKHFSHRFALLRKLRQKNSVYKITNVSTSSEQRDNILLSKKMVTKPIEIKKSDMYSYVNPKLRSKTYNNLSLKQTECSNIKTRSLNISHKLQPNIKFVNNDKNKIHDLSLTYNKTPERLRSKKTFTKQLCLVFNRFGICSKLDEGKCDKRHYKKYITLCNKFLTGECLKENCLLSHTVVEDKIPFCKHYLNSICVQLKCPFLHEYRDPKVPICKDFLHGYCTLGKKCLKKHLNLCPIFESKNKCPHGQKCLYPHKQSEDKSTVDGEINEPRYFEMTIPHNDEANDNESIHIVPKRHAPLTDLPSYLPLNTR